MAASETLAHGRARMSQSQPAGKKTRGEKTDRARLRDHGGNAPGGVWALIAGISKPSQNPAGGKIGLGFGGVDDGIGWNPTSRNNTSATGKPMQLSKGELLSIPPVDV